MSTTLYLAPLWLLEYGASLVVIVLTLLAWRESRALVSRDPENALWLFLNWLSIVFVIFAFSHFISHGLQDLVFYSDYTHITDIKRVFGGFDTIIYVTIGTIIFFFHRIQRLYRRM